jgi:hypothetical protein
MTAQHTFSHLVLLGLLTSLSAFAWADGPLKGSDGANKRPIILVHPMAPLPAPDALQQHPVPLPLSAVPAPPPPSDNLLINGSFEQPALTPGGWSVWPAVPGWVAVDGPGIEVQRGAAGPAQHGEQLVELDSHGNSAMVQAVAVHAGATYELRFWTMARPGTVANTNGLDVFVNDVQVHRERHTHSPQRATTGFQEVRLRWTAGPDVTQAVLRFEASGCSDSLGSYLDNVSWRRVGRD